MIFKKTKYIFSFLLLFVSINVHSQNLDSLLSVAEILKDDTAKVNRYNEILLQLLRYGKFNEVIEVGEKSFKLSEKLSYPEGIALSTKSIGNVYYNTSRYDTALYYYKISYDNYKLAENKSGQGKALHNLGNIYNAQGNWKLALETYYESLKIREEINDERGIAAVYNALGLTYANSGDEQNSLDFYRKALKIHEKTGNKRGLISSYLRLGNAYYRKLNEKRIEKVDSSLMYSLADSALNLLNKGVEICNSPEFEFFIGIIDEVRGNIYLMLSNKEKSLEAFENSLKIKEKYNNPYALVSIYASLGGYYRAVFQERKAKEYFIKAFDFATQIKAQNQIKDLSKDLAYFYRKEGKYKAEAEMLNLYIKLNDSLKNEDNIKKMAQLGMQYEFDKKQKMQELEHKRQEELRKAEKRREFLVKLFLTIGFAFTFVIAIVIFKSFKTKQKANKQLEEKNSEILNKNALLNQQNEEIEAQRDEIEKQRDYVIQQRDKIASQNKHITDSIVYAKRIQQAVLPPQDLLGKLIKEYFILFKPRDIVSGDFYWATQKGNKAIIVAADCTGHGVPGAFMSLLGVSNLNEIVNKVPDNKIEELTASYILNELRTAVKTSLRQTGKFDEAKDGMDMALCIIDKDKNTIQYSGAYNPLLLVRNGEIAKYKADRMPVGINQKNEKDFTNNVIQVQENDLIYIFSDGIIDQFGGQNGRKFMMPQFNQLILANYQKPLQEQKEIFDNKIESWRTNEGTFFKQLDDILVICFRI